VAIWFLNDSFAVQSAASLGNVPPTWSAVLTGDYDGDGKSDILWTDTSGNVAIWFMNGANIASTASLGNVGTTWGVVSANAE
jgi:FG-GAP repeat